MTSNEMIKRTKQFAVDCGYLILSLELSVVNRAYSSQLICCSSSVDANNSLQETNRRIQ